MPKHVLAHSSPTHRVVDTASTILAALFRPTQDQVWSEDAKLAKFWQPISVDTDSVDKTFSVGETPCPIADNMVPSADNDPAVQQLFVEYKDLLDKLGQAINESLTTFRDVSGIYDVVLTESGYFGDDYKRPEWLDNQTLEMLHLFYETAFGLDAKLPKTYFRYKSGPFFKELLTNLNQATDDSKVLATNEKQLFLYASHDTIIRHILQAIHFYKGN